MTDDTVLKPCPCGKTPNSIAVDGDGSNPKWAYVRGLCCGDWSVEFRNNYEPIGGYESKRRATEAWNNAPRAEDKK